MADGIHAPIDLTRLSAPFPPEAISWRVGSTNSDKTKGMALAYIDARDVMKRLDDVCGYGWQCDYVPMPNGTCCCRIGIRVGGEWIWRSNGSINLTDFDKAEAKEMAEKGSYSDAFKRAAVLWGVGQYLYGLDSPWVEIEQRGKSYIIKQNEYARLRRVLPIPGAAPTRSVEAVGGYASPPPGPPAAPHKVINPETGREIDPYCANQLRKPGGRWDTLLDRMQGFEDNIDLDGLKQWFSSEPVQNDLAKWPVEWRDEATKRFDDCHDRIDAKMP